MSNNQPETKQQFGFVSAPEGLPPLRLRLAVGGIATVVALTEFGATNPARADHETEEGEGKDCDYGFHARWIIDVNEDGQPGPSPEEYGCFTRKDCGVANPLIALPEGAPELTPQQRASLGTADLKMMCRGDSHPKYDEWFEANPWAQPYRVIIEEEATTPEDSTTETEPEPVVEPTEPETTEDTTPEEVVDEQQPDTGTATTTETEPEPVVEPTERETTEDTTPEEVVDEQQPDTGTATTAETEPEPVVEPTERETTEDTTPEEVVDEQQPDTGTATTTETEPDQPEPVVEPTEPETTEDTTPEEVVDEQQPDTGTATTAETEPDQPEPVVEPTEPETTSTTALVEQRPPDTETDTDTSVLPDVLVVGAIGAVALSSIYLFRAKKIKMPSRLRGRAGR